MIVAHLSAVPVEELVALAPAAGAFWLALRTRARDHLTSGEGS